MHNRFHHADRLPQGAHIVVLGKGILLQEILSNNLGNLQGQLLVFGERVLADQLHNFVQLYFLMQNLLDFLSQVREFLIKGIEIAVQLPLIVARADGPVHGWEMFTLC